jgi:transcriptional regulator with XRE-family HTH domain
MEQKELFFDHLVFRRRRESAGLTVEQMAERMKAQRQWVAVLEAGISLPNVRSIERFARALGFETLIDFLDESGNS